MTGDLRVEVAAGLAGVTAAAWDALAGDDNPFVTRAFLRALEASGSVGEGTGWEPCHLLAWRGERLVGAAPCYLKDNSYGEYIFDWGWADAARRAGLRYYPKLVVAVPHTPATGPRILTAAPGTVGPLSLGPAEGAPDAHAAVGSVLAVGARALAEEVGAHSVHWLFIPEGDRDVLVAHGYAPRLSWQYHFTNPGWRDFQDFLDALVSKRRKEIRRERAQAASHGLELAVEPVSALSQADLHTLHRCYLGTVDAHGAIPYLTPDWWMGLGDHLGDLGVVATARRGGRLIAGALAFARGRHLYGRYWGATEDLPALHFELCYYQLIAHAVATGCTRVEAGAQGEHKIARGFAPSFTHSAHWLRHPGLSDAVLRFLPREALQVRRTVDELAAHTPFRDPAG